MPTLGDELFHERTGLPIEISKSGVEAKATRAQTVHSSEAAIRKHLRPNAIDAQQPTWNLIDVIRELQHGKLPNNRQVKQMLQYICDAECMNQERQRMTSAGQDLWDHLKDMLFTLEQVIDEKNPLEYFQQFAYHSRLASNAVDESLSNGML